MAGFIAQQPNGLYCRFSTIVEAPTHWNFTKGDYLNNITETVPNREYGEMIFNNYLQPFSEVLDRITTLNMTQQEIDEWVKLVSEEDLHE